MKLVCLSYQLSHFIPIMNYILNHEIKDCIFFGESNLREYSVPLGYEFIECRSTEYIHIIEYRKNKQKHKYMQAYRQLHNEIEEIIGKYNISEMYCDISRYMFYAPVADKRNMKMTIYWTYNGPTHMNFRSYPQTVYSKNENIFGCLWEWLKQFYYGEVKSQKICYYFKYPYNFLFKPHNIFKLRYSIDGLFVNADKIICGPESLVRFYDTRTKFDKPKLTYYLKRDNSHIEEILESKEKKVYISLGTNNIRYSKGNDVVSHIVNCLKNKGDLWVIINMGNAKSVSLFNYCENIVYVRDVNQVDIIKRVDYVIFHGGFGTLKECYYLHKKIIVIPFMYDQFANARMIERMQIGKYVPVTDVELIDFYVLLKSLEIKSS